MSLSEITGIFTAVMASGVFFVYWFSKCSELSNAAAIVVMDIRQAEQALYLMIEEKPMAGEMIKFFHNNSWEKYKHLLVKKLSSDDVVILNRFFEGCSRIGEAQRDMVEIFNASLRAKAEHLQEKLASLQGSDKADARDKIIENFNIEESVFNPKAPFMKIDKALQSVGPLTHTLTFDKLRRISGLR